MRFHLTPEPLLFLITTFLLAPRPSLVAASPQPTPTSSLHGFTYDELFARWDCSGQTCGYYGQLCCKQGHGCYTNAKTQAECTSNGWQASASGGVASGSASFSAAASQSVSITASAAAAATASATAQCHVTLSGETPCGAICCASTQWCAFENSCSPLYGAKTSASASTTKSPASPGALGTSFSSGVVTTTSKVPYVPPVAGGSNVTMTEINGGSSLSGGAIAGIVVGVLVGLLILGIICFYCCIKGIWDGCLAIFGVGRKRKVTEVDEYTRRTHHSSGGQRRTWYGAPVKTKTRVENRDSHLGRDLLGMGAGLAGLWAILGMKRRRENRRNEEKYSEYSYSSDYYTSESE